jgi:hypothetical protein
LYFWFDGFESGNWAIAGPGLDVRLKYCIYPILGEKKNKEFKQRGFKEVNKNQVHRCSIFWKELCLLFAASSVRRQELSQVWKVIIFCLVCINSVLLAWTESSVAAYLGENLV